MPNIRSGVRLPFPWIEGLSRRQQLQIYEDFQALGARGAGSVPTVFVAASNARQRSKDAADIVCRGSSDEERILEAFNLLPGLGGRVVFSEGDFYLTADGIDYTLASGENIHVMGLGKEATIIHAAAGVKALEIDGDQNSWWTVSDLSILGSTGNAIEIVDGGLGDQNPYLHVHDCRIETTSGYGIRSTHAATCIIQDNYIVTTTGRGINIVGYAQESGTSDSPHVITGNKIAGDNDGIGIRLQDNDGSRTSALIDGNVVMNLATGMDITWSFYDEVEEVSVTGNQFYECSLGMNITAQNVSVLANMFNRCGRGITLGDGNATTADIAILGNHFTGTSGASNHIQVFDATVGTSQVVIGFNRFYGASPAYCVTIASGCDDCALLANDTDGGYGTAPYSDSGTNTRYISDLITTDLSVSALTDIRKNSGGSTYSRHRINFIEGSGITLTVADDAVDDEIDVTIAKAAAGSDVTVRKNSTGSDYTRGRLNFIEGASGNVTITVADDAVDDEVDITIDSTGGGSGGKSYTKVLHNWAFR